MPRCACSAGEVAVLVTNAIVGRRMHNQRPGPWPAAGGAPRSRLVLSWGRRGGWDCLRRCAEGSPPGRRDHVHVVHDRGVVAYDVQVMALIDEGRSERRPRPEVFQGVASKVWRAKLVPRRSRRSRCSAPTLSGPTGTRRTCAGGSASSSADVCGPSAERRASSTRTRLAGAGARRRQGRPRRTHRATARHRCEHDRRVLAEPLEHIANSEPHGTAVDRSSRGIVSKHRDPERAPARRRQSRQHLIEDVIDKVSEPDVDEGLLGLGRTRRDNPDPPGAGEAHALEPERRLADSRFTLKDHRRRSVRHTVEERGHTGALLVPTESLPLQRAPAPSRTSHRPHTTPYSSRGVVRYQATTSYRDSE